MVLKQDLKFGGKKKVLKFENPPKCESRRVRLRNFGGSNFKSKLVLEDINQYKEKDRKTKPSVFYFFSICHSLQSLSLSLWASQSRNRKWEIWRTSRKWAESSSAPSGSYLSTQTLRWFVFSNNFIDEKELCLVDAKLEEGNKRPS